MADAEQFVSRIKLLEKLKAQDHFPQSLCESGKYILFFNNGMVCLNEENKLVLKEYEDVVKWNKYVSSKSVFLDVWPQPNSFVCLFAVDVENPDTTREEIENEVKGQFVNLRHSMFFLDTKESEYVNHASGLLNFCRSVKFCCFCSGNLETKGAGHKKTCTSCNRTHYPTLSPVGLTLIEDNNHQEVLLVRQDRHPPGMYTCVAGFIEAGESLEENVKREVAEEVGLKITKVEYCISQHWALPASQLTLGCIASASNKNIVIDTKELQHAKWVRARDLKDAILRTRNLKEISNLDPQKLWAPPQSAVSHNLMVAWLKKYHNFNPAQIF